MATPKEKRERRLAFMNRLYEVSDGDRRFYTTVKEVADAIGLSEEEGFRLADYLVGEGLLSYQTYGGGISIEHRGVVEVEAALSTPEQPTEHFPPAVNVIHVEHMVGSQIQQGTRDSVQGQTTDLELGAVSAFLDEVAGLISAWDPGGEDTRKAESDIASIRAQLSSPRPSHVVVRELLSSLRTVLETTLGTAMAAGVITSYPQLFS